MFLWSILQKSESELLKKFLFAQQLNPVKNDLCLQFDEDLKQCNITLTMSEISQMKESKFRILVKTQIRKVATKYLLSLKAKHSKLDSVSDEYRLERYLSSSNISTEEKQTLFKLRTRMVDVKSNFKIKYGSNLTCTFCIEEENQSHLLSCQEITVGLNTTEVKYSDIFGDLPKQEKIAKLYNKILKQRQLKLKILSLGN